MTTVLDNALLLPTTRPAIQKDLNTLPHLAQTSSNTCIPYKIKDTQREKVIFKKRRLRNVMSGLRRIG